MSKSTSIGSVRYFSRFTHGVDDKRRVQIPAKWRSGQGESPYVLILWESNGDAGSCLRVYPPDQMDALMEKISIMSTSEESAVALRRNIAENCEPITTDKQGRICIPDNLATLAAIEASQPAILAGALEWFEIWNPDRHTIARRRDAALAPESVKQI